jgi:hypothetical protein
MMVEPWEAGLEGVWSALAVLMMARLLTLGWRYQSQDGPVPPMTASGNDISRTSSTTAVQGIATSSTTAVQGIATSSTTAVQGIATSSTTAVQGIATSSTTAVQGIAPVGRVGKEWRHQQQHLEELHRHPCEFTVVKQQQPEGQHVEQQLPGAGCSSQSQDSTAATTSDSSSDAGAHVLLLNNSLPGTSKLQAHRKQLQQAYGAPGKPKYRKVHNGCKQVAVGLYNREDGNSGTSESATAAVTETAKREPLL